MNGVDPMRIQTITTGRPFDSSAAGKISTDTGQSFQEMLTRNMLQSQTLTFSKHAISRTEQRGIELSQTDINRLNDAVGKARGKGLTDTLIFMNNTAFIVNTPNKVVVTVVDSAEFDNTVFTNIDGAVIA